MFQSKKLRAMESIFNPKNIAVIGASKSILKWGSIILANLISGGYQNKVYPINLKQSHILGIKAYPSLNTLPEPADMVYICLPAKMAPEYVEICGEANVKTIVLIAAGFSEIGPEGVKLEDEVKSIAKKYPVLNIIGPNTMGIANPHIKMYALMPPVTPKKGTIAFVSQSGNLGTQMMSFGESQHVGFSKFVSSGNELLLRTEDFIEYFGQDPETNTILCYVEGIKDPKKFTRIAKQVSLKKPIIIYKSGKYTEGARAALSHTGALTGSYKLYQAIFKQCGIIEARNTIEMIDYAKAFSRIPLLKGDKIGILSWGGGWAVITADKVIESGLKVPSLPPKIIQKLDIILPPYWSKNNPIDLVGTLNRRSHLKSLEYLYEAGMDGIIALGVITGGIFSTKKYQIFQEKLSEVEIFMNEFNKTDIQFLKKIKKLINKYQKPIIIVTLTENELVTGDDFVIYSMPEQATQAFKKLYNYYKYRLSHHKIPENKMND
ncbi:MAG: acetate--CoA ligase family protein [Promethearchaeota archaeon]